MTDQTLKSVLIQALKESSENPSTVIDHWTEDGETTLCIDHVGRNECHFDLDRITTAIRDHVLNREKIGSVVDDLFEFMKSDAYWLGREKPRDLIIDRLIEGLTR